MDEKIKGQPKKILKLFLKNKINFFLIINNELDNRKNLCSKLGVKMRNIVLDQNFHGIGQGLFYSGKITFQSNNDTKNSFNFIYDCGSSSRIVYLINEIKEYKKLNLTNKKLDLLMISHLHSDHVNGVERILSDIEVKNVVLPYLKPIERALLSVYEEGPSWYFEFLSNPTNFLKKRGVKNIIYVSRGEDVKVTPPETSEGPLNEVEFSLKMDFEGMKHDIEKEAYARKNDEFIDINVTFKKDSYSAKIFNLWDFYFYTSPIDEKKIEPFFNAVRQIQNESKDREISHDSILEIIRDKNKRKDLKEIYEKKITKDLNFTSMACLHGPIYLLPYIDLRYEFNLGLWPFPFIPPYRRLYENLKFMYHKLYDEWLHILCETKDFYRNRSYSFLTGDINSNSEWDGIKRRYLQLFKYMQFLQIPHHGSQKNWNYEIPLDVGLCDYIISAGIRNQFKHPDLEVIKNISQSLSPDVIKWAHEYRSQIYRKMFILQKI